MEIIGGYNIARGSIQQNNFSWEGLHCPVLYCSLQVAERCLPLDSEHLRRVGGYLTAMTDAICELRAGGRGVTPQVD